MKIILKVLKIKSILSVFAVMLFNYFECLFKKLVAAFIKLPMTLKK
jgi:hypothetical protein